MVSFRFDPDYDVEGRHYTHPLIDWSAVTAGVLLAIAIGFVLTMLGVAIGAAAFNPYDYRAQEDPISIGGGLYLVFAHLLAFQAGAYVATRAARFPDHFGGLLTGAMVWAAATFVAVLMVALTASGAAGADALAGQASDLAGDVRASADIGDLAAAEAGADAASTLAWWATGALLLGLAGAVAGAWLGCCHPKWENRPRASSSAKRDAVSLRGA